MAYLLRIRALHAVTEIDRFAQPLRIVWLAVCAGAALAMGVMGWLSLRIETHALADHAEGAFYVVALLGAAGTAGAFALVRRMETQLSKAGTDAEAEATIRLHSVAALAAAEVPALAGALAALLTGDLLALAFGVPLFAFAALLWPSDDRVSGWLRLRGL